MVSRPSLIVDLLTMSSWNLDFVGVRPDPLAVGLGALSEIREVCMTHLG